MQKRPDTPSSGNVGWDRNEIESHSSNLTNQRLFNIMEVVWTTSMTAMSHAGSDPMDFALCVFEYFGSCLTLYISAAPMFMTQNNRDVGEHLLALARDGNRLKRSIRSRKVPGRGWMVDCEDLLEKAMQMHYLMTLGMQNLKYLFRIGQQEPRGLDAHLALFSKSALWRTGGVDGKA